MRISIKSLFMAFAILTFATLENSNALAQTYSNSISIPKPAEDSLILTAVPDVSLSELTAVGTSDPKVEWSKNAQKYVSEAIEEAMIANKLKPIAINPEDTANERGVQILKLNKAVNQSIAAQSIYLLKLPTKTEFNWTLGEGASALVADGGFKETEIPQYMLFVQIEGSYSSAGRKAMMVGALLVGGYVAPATQIMQGSLVDLKTGQVVWYDFESVPFMTDIRTKEGAKTAVTEMFKKMPLWKQ